MATVPGPTINAPAGQPLVQNGQFTPAGAAAFAGQATGGGNPYGPPPTPQEGAGAYDTLAGFGYVPPTVPGPEAPPHPALPNPDQTYVDNFMASVGRQRQAIDNQLAASTQQLGARRDAAAGVVAGLPANFRAHFNAARDTAGLEQKVATGAGVKGNDRALGANANNQLANATLTNTNAAAQSTVPLLNEGVVANYGQGLDTLNAAHTAAEGQLDSTVAGFDASQAAAATAAANSSAAQQAAYAHDDASQAAGFKHDQAMAQWSYDHPTQSASQAATAQANAVDPQTGMTAQQEIQYAEHYNYTSPQGWKYAEQHGPTVANALAQAQKTGDTKEYNRIWGDMGSQPDMVQWLGLNRGLRKPTK